MRDRPIIIAVVSLACFVTVAYAQAQQRSVAGLFEAAAAAYREGNFTETLSLYEKILERGEASGNLYYNIGNTYVKLGLPGKAFLNYERARVLIPRDSDLRANAAYVASQLNVEVAQSSKKWFLRALDRLFEGLTVDEAAVLLSALFLLCVVGLFIRLFIVPAKTAALCMLIAAAVAMAVAGFALKRKIAFIEHGAVVIIQEAGVRFEPALSATTYFKLGEGSRVFVLEKREGWYKIERPDGKLGWAPEGAIERIAP